jgi:class 3 adenylate cyclase
MEEERIEAMEAGESDSGHSDLSDGPAKSEDLRKPVTILFSDIKGSTSYFEQKGDLEGLAMLERHNRLLLPCIDQNDGQLVKTIGDALMALFRDPADAVRAAVDMQNSLVADARGRADSEQIHIRIGIHAGLGLIHDNDVFGDVVNAAARIQAKSLPDQILITDALVGAAHTAGYQVGRLGRTRLEGKEESIDIYAMSWSPASTQHLIDDLQARYEDQIGNMREARIRAEEEIDQSKAEWRNERRKLHAEVERLEDGIRDALRTARGQITEEFRQELRFQLEAAESARAAAEGDLQRAHDRFETERFGYRAQIESLEQRVVEALERMNNPARMALDIQNQVEERVGNAKEQWEAQWRAEREALTSAIQKLRKTNPMAEARRQVEERLKEKKKSKRDPEALLEEAGSERDAMARRVRELEEASRTLEERIRREVSRELRHRYDERAEQASRIQTQLEQQVRTLEGELAAQKSSLSLRIRELEDAIPKAREATRRQTLAEMEAEFQAKVDDSERARGRLERRSRDEAEVRDIERSELMEKLETTETRLEEARELAFRRAGEPAVEELNRLRAQLDDEFRKRLEDWEEEKRRLLERIQNKARDEEDL